MPKIAILSEQEVQKIAAGEVVERPASIVKELLENALDAGATEIEIAVENGGKDAIVITDNGCGMEPDDLALSMMHHATSKIRSVDDLTSISTFGFRGEALSSIASVSTCTITTRTATAQEGVYRTVAAGRCIADGVCAANQGTVIRITDLFKVVPARRKFLKQRDTEWRAIAQLVHAYAAQWYHIGFTLLHDGVQRLRVPASQSMFERVCALWDADAAAAAHPCEFHDVQNNISVKGVVASYQVHRFDRSGIVCSVNGRWVKNYQLGKAVIKGYQNALPQGTSPLAVIAITVNPAEVDINIHPRKEEVSLLHPGRVSAAIEEAVLSALHKATDIRPAIRDTFLPEMSRSASVASVEYAREVARAWEAPRVYTQQSLLIPQSSRAVQANQVPVSSNAIPSIQAIQQPEVMPAATVTAAARVAAEQSIAPVAQQEEPSYRVIGVYNATYILIETERGLMVLDQHAVHERLLYNELQEAGGSPLTSELLFPEVMPLDAHGSARVLEHASVLAAVGIIVEPWLHQIRITAYPQSLSSASVHEVVKAIAVDQLESAGAPMGDHQAQLYHAIRAMVACKAAVKAGDVLSSNEINRLVDRYQRSNNRMTCPHGRPTSWLLSASEFVSWFKR